MRNRAIFVPLLFFSLVGVSSPSHSQVQSPPAKAACKFSDGKTISINYASPRMRGRKIFGDLVPFGEVWRAGADDATSFVTDTNVDVGGKSVPAGRYTLFIFPTQDKWTLIISKTTGEWGVPYPGEKSDFTRAGMKLSKLSAPQENFTISFDPTGSGCAMSLEWETTRASIQITQKK
jgi:hypothetical protein